MEAYSLTSSSSSSSLHNNLSSQYNLEEKKPSLQSHQVSLHAVRKPQAKPWKKHAIAPLPPTPPKVYRVDPINFRDLVQRLTGVTQSDQGHRRLHRIAPPSLDTNNINVIGGHVIMPGSSLELNLWSPSGFCSFPLPSPSSLSNLEHGAVS